MARHLAVRHFDAVANPAVCSGRVLWAGYVFTLDAGATVDVYDGEDVGGELVGKFTAPLATPITYASMPGATAVVCERGLFVDVSAGAVTCATVFAVPETTLGPGVSIADDVSFDL